MVKTQRWLAVAIVSVGCTESVGPREFDPEDPDRAAIDDEGDAGDVEENDVEPEPPALVPFDTKEHGSAAFKAVARASCSNYLVGQLGVQDTDGGHPFTPPYSFLWGNDPDCNNDDCGGKSIDQIHGSDSTYCWACRNMDHFIENPAWNPPSTPADPMAGTSRTSDFRDNPDALDRLSRRAFELAQQASQAGDSATRKSLGRQAARAALRGCHYLTDQLACGHKTGNKVCDPGANSLSQRCRDWVDTNRDKLSFYNNRIVGLALTTCSGEGGLLGKIPKCHDQLASGGWYEPEGESRRDALSYAAAERLVRHYSAGATLDERDGTTWKNECHADCSNGECLAGEAKSPVSGTPSHDRLVDACRELLDATLCQALPKNKIAMNTSCACNGTGGDEGGGALGCEVIGECRDAMAGESGFATCEEALAAEPIACCGDGICAASAGETPASCPEDCDSCGDGTCDPGLGENCTSCASDCSCSPPYECEAGVCTCTEVLIPPAQCGTTVCSDRGPCPSGYACVANQCVTVQECGNGVVEPGEQCESGYDCAIGDDCIACRCEESECPSRCGNDVCECDEERFCFADCYHGGGGGGGGGGGCSCDCDLDGSVTEEECTGGCGGVVKDGFCEVGGLLN